MKYKQVNNFNFVHKRNSVDISEVVRILRYGNEVVFSFYTECDSAYWNVFEKDIIDFFNNKTTTNVSKIIYQVYNYRLAIFYKDNKYEQIIFLDNSIPEKYKSYFVIKDEI